MKQFLLTIVATLILVPAVFAGGKDDNKKTSEEVHWLTWDEVQVEMKKEPRFVWVDVYTDWCGWCKRMDKTTFSNPDVIKYINKHFYAVKFNAEAREDIRFMGQMYKFDATAKANALATKLMNGRMSYPTSILMAQNFQNPAPIPGYMDVAQIELFLKFFGEGAYKTQQFPAYQKAFKSQWK